MIHIRDMSFVNISTIIHLIKYMEDANLVHIKMETALLVLKDIFSSKVNASLVVKVFKPSKLPIINSSKIRLFNKF